MPDLLCRHAATHATRGAAGHSGQENGQGPPSPRRPSKAPHPKCFSPCSRSSVLSPRPAPPLAAELADEACPPPGATHKPRLAPEGPLRRGLARQCLGLGTPEPQRWTHRLAPPPPGPLGVPSVIQGGRMGRSLRAPGDFRRPPAPKRLGPCSCSPAPSSRFTPLLAAEPVDWDCRPPGCYPNRWWAPEWPIPGSYCCNTGDWGLPSPSARLTLQPRRHPGRYRCRRSFREGEQTGTSEAPGAFVGPCAKTLGTTLPFASALTSAHPSARCTAGISGLPAS